MAGADPNRLVLDILQQPGMAPVRGKFVMKHAESGCEVRVEIGKPRKGLLASFKSALTKKGKTVGQRGCEAPATVATVPHLEEARPGEDLGEYTNVPHDKGMGGVETHSYADIADSDNEEDPPYNPLYEEVGPSIRQGHNLDPEPRPGDIPCADSLGTSLDADENDNEHPGLPSSLGSMVSSGEEDIYSRECEENYNKLRMLRHLSARNKREMHTSEQHEQDANPGGVGRTSGYISFV